jgi:hypothetical protein
MSVHKELTYSLALAVIVKGQKEFFLIHETMWHRVGGRELGSSLSGAKLRAPAKIASVLLECDALQVSVASEPHQFESDGRVRLLYMVEVDTLTPSAAKWILRTKVPVNQHGAQTDLFDTMEKIVLGNMESRDILHPNP